MPSFNPIMIQLHGGGSGFRLIAGFNVKLELNGPQGFWGAGEKGYLFSGSWRALLITLGELGSKHIL